jgi:hypothetical protein
MFLNRAQVRRAMVDPTWDLPSGVYVEADDDSRTVDVLNGTDTAVVVYPADVMRSFGVVVGEEEGTVRLGPGERFTFYRGDRLDTLVARFVCGR